MTSNWSQLPPLIAAVLVRKIRHINRMGHNFNQRNGTYLWNQTGSDCTDCHRKCRTGRQRLRWWRPPDRRTYRPWVRRLWPWNEKRKQSLSRYTRLARGMTQFVKRSGKSILSFLDLILLLAASCDCSVFKTNTKNNPAHKQRSRIGGISALTLPP